MLWEIVTEELQLTQVLPSVKGNIQKVFDKSYTLFINFLNPLQPLLLQNKNFLSQVLKAINQLFPNLQDQKNIFKTIQITNEEVNIPYLAEELQQARQSKFETQLQQKRHEFELSIRQNIPESIDFSDNVKESKIKEMEELISQTIAERNYQLNNLIFSKADSNQSIIASSKPTPQLTIKEDTEKKEGKEISWGSNIIYNVEDVDYVDSSSNQINANLKQLNEKIDTLIDLIHKLVSSGSNSQTLELNNI
jgi:hypothetical protein